MCHSFVARHLPSAGHLRFVSSVLRLNVALERIGDYAVAICTRVGAALREARRRARSARDIDLLARIRTGACCAQAMKAFNEAGTPRLARGDHGHGKASWPRPSTVSSTDLLARGREAAKRPIRDLFAHAGRSSTGSDASATRPRTSAKRRCSPSPARPRRAEGLPDPVRRRAERPVRARWPKPSHSKAFPESGRYSRARAGMPGTDDARPVAAREFMDSRRATSMGSARSPRVLSRRCGRDLDDHHIDRRS